MISSSLSGKLLLKTHLKNGSIQVNLTKELAALDDWIHPIKFEMVQGTLALPGEDGILIQNNLTVPGNCYTAFRTNYPF